MDPDFPVVPAPEHGPRGDAPAISLVVCTRDRAAQLGACLAAIAAMRPALPWELVLVDNGSTDDTPRVLADFAAAAPFPVTLVHESRAGLASARNAGVRAARAPILVFTDDDCYPARDYLDRWAEAFADGAIGFGSGRIVLHDPDDYPITIHTGLEPTPIAPRGFIEPGLVQGANMAYRRDVVYEVGGFDPALGPGGAFNFEDLDMASRAAALGYAGGFHPGPLVRHHHRRRDAGDVQALMRSYDRGRGAYFASLLLRGRLSRVMLSHVRGALAWKTRGAIVRELVAAAQFVVYRLLHPREHPLAGEPHAR